MMVAAQSPGLGLCALGWTIFDDAPKYGHIFAMIKAACSAF